MLTGLISLALGVRPTVVRAAPPVFAGRADLAVGGAPVAIVSGDFNRDGEIDLATANDFSDDVSLLLGSGNGDFSVGGRFGLGAAPSGPVAMVAVDIDADGIVDLVVTNQLTRAVVVLPGRGNGTFGAARSSSTAGTPAGLAFGDFDADGRLDVAVAKPFDAAVTVLRNDGAGTFAPSWTVPVPDAAWDVASGDLDGDGRVDLAACLHGEVDGVAILLGDGAGGFRVARTIDLGPFFDPVALAIDLLDNDDWLDIAVANQGDDSVSVLRGLGGGEFGTPRQYDVSALPRSLAVGDFNLDGALDLVSAGRFFNQVSVLTGLGDGTFELAGGFDTHAAPAAIVIDDFDGDGLPDVATANQESNDVSVLLNDSPVVPLCVGDCDGNGRLTVDELVYGVNLALQETDAAACTAFDANRDGAVTIDELVRGVNNALGGCV